MSPADERRGRAENLVETWLLSRIDGRAVSQDELLREHADLRDLLEPLLKEGLRAEQSLEGAEPSPRRGADITSADESSIRGRRLGDFQLVRELGRGGMGVVYEARQLSLERTIALKVLPAHLTLSAETVERFLREAQAAAKLRHPGVVPVHAVGEDDGTHYFAMELVDGPSLDRVLARLADRAPSDLRAADLHQRFEGSWVRAVVRLALQVAQALQAAHAAGVVHRDVKPSNILLNQDGRALLADFGLSRNSDLPDMTRTGEFQGTPYYVSPEQAMSGRVLIDHRTDIYSLGVSLFELLTLRRPFEGDSASEILGRIMAREPSNPERLNPELPADLARVVLMAMDRDPERRYPSAADLAEDLQAFLDHRPVRARRVSALVRARRWARREPGLAALVAVLVLSLPTITWLVARHLADAPVLQAAAQSARMERVEERLQRGYLELGEGGTDAAIAAFEAALVDAPDSIEARAGVALALLRDDRFDEALDSLSNETATGMLRLRAEVLEELERPAQAAALIADLAPPATALDHFLEGERLLRRVHAGEKDACEPALRAASRAVLFGESRALYHFQLSHAAGHAADAVVAADVGAALRSRWARDGWARFWAGYALTVIDPKVAALDYRIAADLLPDEALVHANLGVALSRSGQTEEAEAALLRALELQDDHAIALEHLGFLRQMGGELDQAEELYYRAVDADPDNSVLRYNLAYLLRGRGAEDQAEVQLRVVVELDPGLAQGWRTLSSLLRDKGDLQGALDAARTAVEAAPEAVNGLIVLGNAWRSLEDLDASVEAYTAALALDDTLPIIHENLVAVLQRAGRQAELSAELLRWAELSERDVAAWLAVVRQQMSPYLSEDDRDLDLAERAARQAVELTERGDAEALFNLGAVLHTAGSVEQAKAVHAEALQAFDATPGGPPALREVIQAALDSLRPSGRE